jgi:hypothetical protein
MLIKFNKILDVSIILIIYVFFHTIILKLVGNIPSEIFSKSFTFFTSSFSYFPSSFLFLSVVVFLIVNFQKFHWENFENYRIIKVFVLILSSAIFWEQGFYDYNFYLDSDIILDKMILFVFFAFIYYNPIFVFLFLFQSLLIWQSNMSPLGSFHWTDIRPAYEILLLFVVFMIVKRFRDINTTVFILLAITLHAANYFLPGIAKMEISPNAWEWTFLNELNNLFISSYVNGWLGFLNEEHIIFIAHILDKLEVIVTVVTMLIQIGALFLLYSKRISITFFIGFELLHLGIFFASGIFFWAWIIVNLAFIYVVKKLPKESLEYLYSTQTLFIFVVIVLLSPIIYQSPALAWWDGRINTIYDFYATTDDDKVIRLNRNDFSPYDIIFTQNRFYYTSNKKVLNNTYGVIQKDAKKYSQFTHTVANHIIKPILGRESSYLENNSYTIYSKLENAKNIDELENIIEHYGTNYYNEEKKINLENFIKVYITNYNKVESKHSWYHKLGAPYHIYDLSAKRLRGGEDKKS